MCQKRSNAMGYEAQTKAPQSYRSLHEIQVTATRMICEKPSRVTISPHQLRCFHSRSTTHKRRARRGVKVRNCTSFVLCSSLDSATALHFPEISIFQRSLHQPVSALPLTACGPQHSLTERIHDLTTYHHAVLSLHSSYVGPKNQADGAPHVARGDAAGQDCRPNEGRHL